MPLASDFTPSPAKQRKRRKPKGTPKTSVRSRGDDDLSTPYVEPLENAAIDPSLALSQITSPASDFDTVSTVFDPQRPYLKAADLREEIIQRLKTGNLLSLAECKNALRRLLRSFAAEARKDFAQLMFLDEYRRTISIYKPFEENAALDTFNEQMRELSQLVSMPLAKDVEIPDFAGMSPDELSGAQGKFEAILVQVHASILRLFDHAMAMRKQRMRLIKIMLTELEESGEFDGELEGLM